MIKDYNSTAYLSVEKFPSSERNLKMPEKPGMPYSASLPTREKLQPWVSVGIVVLFFFPASVP